MKQNPSWEANSHSSSQKIHHPLWRERSLPCQEEPTYGPYPEPH